jgi:HAMP domain-containing protein
MATLSEDRKQIAVRLLAEFAIVVLGVTLALWADSWVTDRGNRAEETARLYALQDNITETLESVADERDNAAAAADTMRQLVQQRDIPQSELRRLLRFSLFYGPMFSPELNVYDDLKNSGELALLTNRDLRRSLATMDSRLSVLQLAMSDLANVQQLNIDSYAIDETNLRFFYGVDLGVDWIDDDEEADFDFISEIQFKNRMLLKLDLVSQLVIRFDDAEAALENVQQDVAAQLVTDQQ